jgi:hypothetical protein
MRDSKVTEESTRVFFCCFPEKRKGKKNIVKELVYLIPKESVSNEEVFQTSFVNLWIWK